MAASAAPPSPPRGSAATIPSPPPSYDAFPLRVHKFFFVSPKHTEAAPRLATELRAWIAKTYGETTTRECEAAVSEIGKMREALVQLGATNSTSAECLVSFHSHFDAFYAPQCFVYIRSLTEFVNKTRGTAASRGIPTLKLEWSHWLLDGEAEKVSTQSLNYELYAAIWNLAAGYSVYATVLPPLLRASSNATEAGISESVECLAHRSRNYRRSAMLFQLLERTVRRIGFVVDEFHPEVLRVIRLVMLAQSQECMYLGHKIEKPGLAERVEHAALANAAVSYYRDAINVIHSLPQLDDSVSSQSTRPSDQLPDSLFEHCYSAGMFLRVAMISHIMDSDRGDSLLHGKLQGNCMLVCDLIKGYLRKTAELCIDEEASFAKIFRDTLSEYETILEGLKLKNDTVFKEPVWDMVTLEEAEPQPRNEVALDQIVLLSISEGLRQVYMETSPQKFSCILSLESQKLWNDYRRKRATQFGLHQRELAEFKTLVVNTLESSSAIFPLLYLYFAAHSLGCSGTPSPPVKTPLGSKAMSVLQGATAWSSFNTLCSTMPELDRASQQIVSELRQAVRSLRAAIADTTHHDKDSNNNNAFEMPATRCEVLMEEYKAFQSTGISTAMLESALLLRRSEPFVKEFSSAIAMPQGFWRQVCDHKERAPALDPASDGAVLQTPSMGTGGLAEEDIRVTMERDELRGQAEEARKALKLRAGPGFFGLFSSSSAVDAAADGTSVLHQQRTPFSIANQELCSTKLMMRIHRLVDDILLPIEDLQEELMDRMAQDIKTQNTEVPIEESSSDYCNSKLVWLSKFTQRIHDLTGTGKRIVSEIGKMDPGKEALVDELRSNFGYSAAGGPNTGSSCRILGILSEVTKVMREYRMAHQVYTLVICEGALVRSQCNDIVAAKVAAKAAAAAAAAAALAAKQTPLAPVSAASMRHQQLLDMLPPPPTPQNMSRSTVSPYHGNARERPSRHRSTASNSSSNDNGPLI